MSLEVRGAADMKRIAGEFEAAARTLNRDLVDGAAAAVKPLTRDIPASALATLPRSGGLAARTAAAGLLLERLPNGARINTTKRYQFDLMDKGTVRHPVYRTGRWVAQHITPGWLTRPILRNKPHEQAELEKSLQRNADRVR